MRIEYLLIKPNNDFCSTIVQFKSFLLSNQRISMDDKTIAFSGINLDYTIMAQDVVWKKNKEIVFYFTVSTDAKNVLILENFDYLLHRINEECGNQFKVNTIWDDVSIHYTNNLYPVMVETENLLRKLIYRFMIKTAGSAWFSNSVPDSVREAIKKNAERNKLAVPDVDQLYLTDFIQLGIFFFEKYTTKPLNQNAIQELKEIINGKNKTDKSITAFLETYEARSNWERYFEEKIEVEDLYKKWQELYKYRNAVAHAKRLHKDEYNTAVKLAKELKAAFEKCIDHIDGLEMTEEEAEAVQEVAKETINRPQMTNSDPWIVKYPGVITGISEFGKAAARITQQVDLDGLSASIIQLTDQQRELMGTVKVESGSLLIGDKYGTQEILPSDISGLLVRPTVPYQRTIDALSIATDPLTALPNHLSVNGINDAGVIKATDLLEPFETSKRIKEENKTRLATNGRQETKPKETSRENDS